MPATINALIAVAGNHQRTHRHRRQPSTHSLPSPSTIDALIAVAPPLPPPPIGYFGSVGPGLKSGLGRGRGWVGRARVGSGQARSFGLGRGRAGLRSGLASVSSGWSGRAWLRTGLGPTRLWAGSGWAVLGSGRAGLGLVGSGWVGPGFGSA